jgi:hypothetical protein
LAVARCELSGLADKPGGPRIVREYGLAPQEPHMPLAHSPVS